MVFFVYTIFNLDARVSIMTFGVFEVESCWEWKPTSTRMLTKMVIVLMERMMTWPSTCCNVISDKRGDYADTRVHCWILKSQVTASFMFTTLHCWVKKIMKIVKLLLSIVKQEL